jgi:hypothetical protein
MIYVFMKYVAYIFYPVLGLGTINQVEISHLYFEATSSPMLGLQISCTLKNSM